MLRIINRKDFNIDTICLTGIKLKSGSGLHCDIDGVGLALFFGKISFRNIF